MFIMRRNSIAAQTRHCRAALAGTPALSSAAIARRRQYPQAASPYTAISAKAIRNKTKCRFFARRAETAFPIVTAPPPAPSRKRAGQSRQRTEPARIACGGGRAGVKGFRLASKIVGRDGCAGMVDPRSIYRGKIGEGPRRDETFIRGRRCRRVVATRLIRAAAEGGISAWLR
jgi:hypothetical protein